MTSVSKGYKHHDFEVVFLLRTVKGNQLTGFNLCPDLTVYSPEGKVLKQFNLKLKRQKKTPELKERHFQIRLKRSLVNPHMPKKYRAGFVKGLMKNKNKIISKMADYYPLFNDLMIDSEGNILVLKNRYVDEPGWKWTPIYQVYSMEGNFLCEFGLSFGKYDTKIDIQKLFANGHLFGIFEKETDDELLYRLLKMQIN